ncbi:conjugal transfer protein TraF [Thermodesulfovibrio thiophilus]|uniref:conjugal transfer protein TraF n=1 Tax=Thermodesulfovibrio thiophilus TaxID=340095 RepID=UPI0003FAB942|nr:conjugal transfer protein TraF [Thermodesulfovibrio thiophilus]
MVRILLTIITVLMLYVPVLAQDNNAKEAQKNSNDSETDAKQSTFYDKSQKPGWWWYKDFKKEKPEQQPKQESNQTTKEQQPEQKRQQPEYKPLKEYTYEELLYMHPDEFAKLYDYYLKKAVQKPTEESVYEFYNIQDVARKKALLFANISGFVWQKYPELTTERDVPIVGPGITQKAEMIKEEVRQYAQTNAQDFGYVVFVQEGCKYCDAQLQILKKAVLDGIAVKVVDIARQPQVAAQFGIETTPTIILVERSSGKHLPIASGVTALDDIYKRTQRAIRLLRGESPETYGAYDFQKGTSLDPTVPSPLWKKKEK